MVSSTLTSHLFSFIDVIQEQMRELPKLRTEVIYHDKVFENEINELITLTQEHYEAYVIF